MSSAPTTTKTSSLASAPQKRSTFHTIYSIFLFNLCYLFGPLLAIVVPFYLIFFSSLWWVGILIVSLYLYFSFDGSERRLGRPWPAFCDNSFFDYLFSYFPMQMYLADSSTSSTSSSTSAKIDDEELKLRMKRFDASQRYVFAVHPHGTLALNRAIFCFNKSKRWNKILPGIETRDLVASSAFLIPVIRDVWLWTNCVDASREVAGNVLRKGYSIIVYPGGEAEQLRTQKGREILWLKSRKGFVRLALEEGAHLVPVYVFGETSMYDTYSIGMKWRLWVSHKFRVALVLFTGKFLAAPYAVPLTAVVGEPIHVDRVEAPTTQQVDELHNRYIQALTNLFESHKEKFGYKDHVLEIL
jgi:hypothetical protein